MRYLVGMLAVIVLVSGCDQKKAVTYAESSQDYNTQVATLEKMKADKEKLNVESLELKSQIAIVPQSQLPAKQEELQTLNKRIDDYSEKIKAQQDNVDKASKLKSQLAPK